MLGNSSLSSLEQVQLLLQDVPKQRLSQLLEELLADLGQERWDLILIFLLMKAGIVKEDELSSPGKCRQMAVEIPWLFL